MSGMSLLVSLDLIRHTRRWSSCNSSSRSCTSSEVMSKSIPVTTQERDGGWCLAAGEELVVSPLSPQV